MSETTQPPKRRPLSTLLTAAVVILLGLLATAGVKSYRDLAVARAHQADLERRIADAESRIRSLRETVHRIEGDELTLERLAREELGLVRPEDIVIVLPEDAADASSPAGPPPTVTARP